MKYQLMHTFKKEEDADTHFLFFFQIKHITYKEHIKREENVNAL